MGLLCWSGQDEVRNLSENSAWGIRRRFERGQYRISTKRFLGYDYDAEGKMVINKEQAKIVKRIYEAYLDGKTPDGIARMLAREKVKNWNGSTTWIATTIASMLANEKYMGDAILQKSYTADFLNKKCVLNDGKLQKYYIENDHEAIIDKDIWEAAQLETARRETFCKEHHTNAYTQNLEINPFSGKLVCGECGNLYSRVKYTNRRGEKYVKWRCGSTNKNGGRKVCTNRYAAEEAFFKLFIMRWNEIVKSKDYMKEKWDRNIAEGDALTRYKTRLIMKAVAKGTISEFDAELMWKVMDHITIYENGTLRIRFYDGTEYEVSTE